MSYRKKYFAKILSAYLTVFLLFSLLFILFFHTPLFLDQKVLFYRGILLLLPTTFAILIFSFFLNKQFLKVSFETLLAAFIISFSFNLSFFIIFPVTFDRSVTTYLLSILRNKPATENCQGLTDKTLEQYFISEYVIGKQAIQRRIVEQSIINMVEKKNNCVQLTTRGRNFLKLLEIIKKVYSIE